MQLTIAWRLEHGYNQFMNYVLHCTFCDSLIVKVNQLTRNLSAPPPPLSLTHSLIRRANNAVITLVKWLFQFYFYKYYFPISADIIPIPIYLLYRIFYALEN